MNPCGAPHGAVVAALRAGRAQRRPEPSCSSHPFPTFEGGGKELEGKELETLLRRAAAEQIRETRMPKQRSIPWRLARPAPPRLGPVARMAEEAISPTPVATLVTATIQGAMVGQRARRAAGTQSFMDLLRHPSRLIEQLTGDAGHRAEADVVALNAGEAREVSAFVRDGHRFRQGSLILDPAAASPVVWRPFRVLGEDIALAAPFHVHGAGPVAGSGSGAVDEGAFRLLSLQAADRYWELAIPAADVGLVRAALRGDGSGR